MKRLASIAIALFVSANLSAQQPPAPAPAGPPTAVTFTGSPQSAIASGVAIPAGKAMFWTSGTTPSAANSNAPAGSRERFGDTRTQAASVLKNIAALLERQGLSMKDVVYLRAYLVPDPTKNNRIDMEGWSAAYGEFFGNPNNPTKPARSTVGVSALVNADWLIEIEAFAVYPK